MREPLLRPRILWREDGKSAKGGLSVVEPTFLERLRTVASERQGGARAQRGGLGVVGVGAVDALEQLLQVVAGRSGDASTFDGATSPFEHPADLGRRHLGIARSFGSDRLRRLGG